MNERFGSTVLQEAGEAIGNIGRRWRRRLHRRQEAEESLQRWLERIPVPKIPLDPAKARAQEDVIDVEYRIIDSEEGDS